MSKKNTLKDPKEAVDLRANDSEQTGDESFELIVHKPNNELVLRNTVSGKEVTVKAKVIEAVEEARKARKFQQLTPDEFQAVLERVDALGFNWSADIPPRLRLRKGVERNESFNEEFNEIQKQYPKFPTELGAVVMYVLTGEKPSPQLVGSGDDLARKAAIVQERLTNTSTYRSEFFFKYAIKVPYFEDLDWEVVIKAYEKNVNEMPKLAYALLNIVLRNPSDPTKPINKSESNEPEFLTVAVNKFLVNKLIKGLIEIQKALKKAEIVAESLSDETAPPSGEANESNNS